MQVMVGSRKRFENKMHSFNGNPDQSLEIRKAFLGTEKYFSETPLGHLGRSEHELHICVFYGELTEL